MYMRGNFTCVFHIIDTLTSLTYFLAISLKELEGKKIIVFIFVDD